MDKDIRTEVEGLRAEVKMLRAAVTCTELLREMRAQTFFGEAEVAQRVLAGMVRAKRPSLSDLSGAW